MSTWGPGPFENEDATTFIREVLEDGPVALEEAFDVVLDQEGYLEAPEGARAVAAAALLGALLTGNHSSSPSAEVSAWLAAQDAPPLEVLRAPALSALDRVEDEDSELSESWSQSSAYQAWLDLLNRIREQLRLPG